MMHLDVTGAPTQGRVGTNLHLGHIPGVGRIVHLGRTPVGTHQHPEQPIDHSPRKEYAPAGIPTRDTCRGFIFSVRIDRRTVIFNFISIYQSKNYAVPAVSEPAADAGATGAVTIILPSSLLGKILNPWMTFPLLARVR